MARRSRSAVYFNVHSPLQGMEDLMLEIQSCGDGMAYDRIPGFKLRLNNMLISVQHLSRVLGRERHHNIIDGLQDMIVSLRQIWGASNHQASYKLRDMKICVCAEYLHATQLKKKKLTIILTIRWKVVRGRVA